MPAKRRELTNLCGPPGFVKERIAAFREAGVTTLNITPIGAPADQLEVIEQLRDVSRHGRRAPRVAARRERAAIDSDGLPGAALAGQLGRAP